MNRDTRESWSPEPATAFSERAATVDQGYPAERARTADWRPATAPRYTQPESTSAILAGGATTLDFIKFSGVPDRLILWCSLDVAVATFRDDAGRSLGTMGFNFDSNDQVMLRCRSVDILNSSVLAQTISVTGYYDPPTRPRRDLDTDRATAPAEDTAPAHRY
jgi:hypothetical protein